MSFPIFPRWVMHEVKDWQQLYVANENGTKELNLVTATLINYTMMIGVNKITDDNVDDVSCRVALLQSVFGCACRKSNTYIQMMESAKKWRRQNVTHGMYCSRRRRVLVD